MGIKKFILSAYKKKNAVVPPAFAGQPQHFISITPFGPVYPHPTEWHFTC